jgi:AraC family ethanolamine operon transcriptional activator
MNDDAILRCEFSDVDSLASRLQGMAASAVPLQHGRYSGAVSTIGLGDITLQIVRGMPMMMLGASAEDRLGLIGALEGSGRARWNARPIEQHEIAICGAGRLHEAIYPDEFACTIVSFAATGAAAALALPEDPGARRSALRADPDAHSVLASAARAAEQALADPSPVLRDAEARRALRATVLEAVQGLLAQDDAAERPHSRGARMRQRIVHEADQYLRANPARPVYTDELCAALGASATRLHQAFTATFGVSPHRYLKMRRMGMARTALLSRAGPWHSVKAAALSHGFWHLGQFAHDYRAMYGESPSETLARARPGAARAA